MRHFLLVPSLALALSACATVPHQTAAPVATATGQPGMVSAADPRAAEAGVEMLRAGGSATDAAIAVMLALTVIEPQSSGIGGGGFYVESDAAGHVSTIDGREKAPAAATPEWFLKDGQPRPMSDAQPGGLSTGVPGSVALIWKAHEEYGKLPWKALFAPAIRLAGQGFVVTPRLHDMLTNNPVTAGLTGGRAIFFDANGQPLPVGATVKNPALAAYLTKLSAGGRAAFYAGDNAAQIVHAVSTAEHNPAPMTQADIAAYTAVERDAVCGEYRGYKICGMGPPSSGATTVFATLKQLERFDLGALGKDSPTTWHLIAESMRLAYADRDKFLGDPGFVSVPVKGLIDPAYLASRSALIDPTRTMATVTAGNPPGAVTAQFSPARPQEEHGTTHFVAVDRWGNAVSYTSTVESPFGSGLMVNGYFLNNELTDFNQVPNGPDGRPTANRVEGGKRPRSSMAPTLVFGPDGTLRLAVGAAGGATIPAQVLKTIIGVLDFHLSAQDAIALPVLFAPGDGVFVEQGSALEAMIPQLQALGHAQVIPRTLPLKANAIERVGGRWSGAADPRSEGKAIGE